MKTATIKIAGVGCLGLMSVGAFNLSCFAADDQTSIETVGNGASTFTMIFKVIVFLLIVIGLFYFIIRLVSKKNQLFQAGRSVKTIGGVSLGQNKSMQLVEVGHRLLIVGVGDNVQLLDTIEDPDEIAFIRERMTVQNNVKLEQLFTWKKRLQKSEQEEQELETPTFQQVFHDKMQRFSVRKQNVDQLMRNDAERLDDQ